MVLANRFLSTHTFMLMKAWAGDGRYVPKTSQNMYSIGYVHVCYIYLGVLPAQEVRGSPPAPFLRRTMGTMQRNAASRTVERVEQSVNLSGETD